MKIIKVELFFHCRDDVSARELASTVAAKSGGHQTAKTFRESLQKPRSRADDLTYSGYSWEEREVVETA